MPDYADLRRHLNERIRLRFLDGEVIEALLLGVDPEEHEDVTYELVSRIVRGTSGAVESPPGTTLIAPLGDLASWESLSADLDAAT